MKNILFALIAVLFLAESCKKPCYNCTIISLYYEGSNLMYRDTVKYEECNYNGSDEKYGLNTVYNGSNKTVTNTTCQPK